VVLSFLSWGFGGPSCCQLWLLSCLPQWRFCGFWWSSLEILLPVVALVGLGGLKSCYNTCLKARTSKPCWQSCILDKLKPDLLFEPVEIFYCDFARN